MAPMVPKKKMNTKKKKRKKTNNKKKKTFNYSSAYSLQPGARGHIIGPPIDCHIPGYTISSGSNNK